VSATHSPNGNPILNGHHKALIELAKGWKPFAYNDDYQCKDKIYEKKGGFALRDKELSNRHRSSGVEVVKMIGKKLYQGKFNLTTISFPIKCMCAKSIIQVSPTIQCVNSWYLNYAAHCSDPVERFKVFMTTTIALIHEG
jgi:hypothetical protein